MVHSMRLGFSLTGVVFAGSHLVMHCMPPKNGIKQNRNDLNYNHLRIKYEGKSVSKSSSLCPLPELYCILIFARHNKYRVFCWLSPKKLKYQKPRIDWQNCPRNSLPCLDWLLYFFLQKVFGKSKMLFRTGLSNWAVIRYKKNNIMI